MAARISRRLRQASRPAGVEEVVLAMDPGQVMVRSPSSTTQARRKSRARMSSSITVRWITDMVVHRIKWTRTAKIALARDSGAVMILLTKDYRDELILAVGHGGADRQP